MVCWILLTWDNLILLLRLTKQSQKPSSYTKSVREVMPLPLLWEQWMRVGSSFMLLSWQATSFSLGGQGQTSTSSASDGNRWSPLSEWYHSSHFFLPFMLWSGNPHQVLWQSLLPLLKSTKEHISKGCTPSYLQHIHGRGRESSSLWGCSRDVLHARDGHVELVSASRALCWEWQQKRQLYSHIIV